MRFDPGEGGEESAPTRRLHPLSWLFVLLASPRQLVIPVVVMVLFGRRGQGSYELIGALGGLVLALNAVAQYYTYRFRIDKDGLRIRSGLFERTFRDIPFRRIHNVAVHQGVLHRVFGVAEVRLESAGGVTPEAQMRVLSLADAYALEALVKQRRHEAADSTDAVGDPRRGVRPADDAAVGEALLTLPPAELLRLGLISNRGMLVLAAMLGALAQSGSGVIARSAEWAVGWMVTVSGEGDAAIGAPAMLLGASVLFVVFVLLLRVLSVALALLQFFGFRLSEQGGRLQVDAGLLTRIRGNTPVRRIQAFSLSETLLHRLFGRRTLRVDTAIIEEANKPRSLRDLVPVATPAHVDALLQRLFPELGWPDLPWQPLHPRAWRRLLVPSAAMAIALTAAMVLRFGASGLGVLLVLPLLILRARTLARAARYAVTSTTVAVREGWLDRHWRFAEIRKLQAIELRQSPFDRRHGMATLWFDTAGATAREPPLRFRYLPEEDARALARSIGARIAEHRLRW
jgi:putative membrane protein